MSDKAQEIGIDGLAKAFHRTDKQIRNLLRDGVLPGPVRHSGRRPLYDYWACHHAYIDYQDGQGRQSNLVKKQEEFLEKKNRKLDMENEEKKKSLVNADDVRRELAKAFTDVKTRIRSIAPKSAQAIAHMKMDKKSERELIAAIQTVLQKEHDECLEELAKWKR